MSSELMDTFQDWIKSKTPVEVEMHRGGPPEFLVRRAFVTSARSDGKLVVDCCGEPDAGYACELRILISATTSKLLDARKQAEPVRSIDPTKAFVRQVEMLLPDGAHFYLNEMKQLH